MMAVAFAIAAVLFLATAAGIDRIRSKSVLLRTLILVLTTLGLFSCSVSVATISGCQRSHFVCLEADCE